MVKIEFYFYEDNWNISHTHVSYNIEYVSGLMLLVVNLFV